jgi:hypothetical protein
VVVVPPQLRVKFCPSSPEKKTLYVVTLQKYFSHPSLVIYFFFATPVIKLKPGQQIGGTLLIANHLDESL